MIKLTRKQADIYTLIYRNPDLTMNDMMRFFGFTRSTLKEHLGALRNKGILKEKTTNELGLKSFRVDKRIKVLV